MFSAELGHIGDRENRILVDDSGVFSPEGVMPSPATMVSFEVDEDKLVQEIYSVASTPLMGDFMPETPQSPESDIELTIMSEVNVSLNSSGLNESDLNDTIQEVEARTSKPVTRKSGRITKAPDRLGMSKREK